MKALLSLFLSKGLAKGGHFLFTGKCINIALLSLAIIHTHLPQVTVPSRPLFHAAQGIFVPKRLRVIGVHQLLREVGTTLCSFPVTEREGIISIQVLLSVLHPRKSHFLLGDEHNVKVEYSTDSECTTISKCLLAINDRAINREGAATFLPDVIRQAKVTDNEGNFVSFLQDGEELLDGVRPKDQEVICKKWTRHDKWDSDYSSIKASWQSFLPKK